MKFQDVLLQDVGVFELQAAVGALMSTVAVLPLHVPRQVALLRKVLVAELALEPDAFVLRPDVRVELVPAVVGHAAVLTLERSKGRVLCVAVALQVVA